MMRYVEVCELLARAQETYYIMKQLATYCVLARTHAVSWANGAVDLPGCRSLIHAVNFESQNVLPRQTAAVAGQKRAERSLMDTWNLHASSHRLGY